MLRLIFPCIKQPPPTKTDPFYGNEYIAQLCGRFITHLFACPLFPSQSTRSRDRTACAPYRVVSEYAIKVKMSTPARQIPEQNSAKSNPAFAPNTPPQSHSNITKDHSSKGTGEKIIH
jgi:hypothetical protein